MPDTICIDLEDDEDQASFVMETTLQVSERAKGAEKASCGETVVQKGVFGESVSSLPQ